MATKRIHRCHSCGYTCDGYDGRGFFGQKISMVVCMNCHTVQPLTVGGLIGEVAPSFATEYGRLCPQCMSDNLRLWDGKTCPKCGNIMTADSNENFWI